MSNIYVCIKCGAECKCTIVNKDGKFTKKWRCTECGFEKEVEFTTEEMEEWR